MWNPLGSKVAIGAGDTPKAIRTWLNARFDNIVALFGLTSANGVRRAMMRDDGCTVEIQAMLLDTDKGWWSPGSPFVGGSIVVPDLGAGRLVMIGCSWSNLEYGALNALDWVVTAIHPNGTRRRIALCNTTRPGEGGWSSWYSCAPTDIGGCTLEFAVPVAGSDWCFNNMVSVVCHSQVVAEV